jgi:hypothetical protein
VGSVAETGPCSSANIVTRRSKWKCDITTFFGDCTAPQELTFYLIGIKPSLLSERDSQDRFLSIVPVCLVARR